MKSKSCFSGSAFVLCIAFLLFQIVSCKMFFGGPDPADDPVKEVKKASIRVSFSASPSFSMAGGSSRTVVPAANLGISSITVTVAHNGGTTTASVTSASETCTIGEITPGAVTVTAEAFAGGALVAEGEAEGPLTITAGGTLSLTIALVPTVTPGTGKGHFAFSLRWPEITGATYVKCSLKDSGGSVVHSDNPAEALTAGGGFFTWPYSDGVAGVPSGAYSLHITFYDN